MKKLFTISLLILAFNINAQINLEITYSSSATDSENARFHYIKTSLLEKFAVSEIENNVIKVYNLNHSIYKTINIPVFNPGPDSDISDADVFAITDDLFNTDSKIEYVIQYHTWNSTTSKSGDFVYIYNEDGTTVFSKDSANLGFPSTTNIYTEGILKTSTGTKLIIQYEKQNDKSIEVYSLPGTLTSSLNQKINSPYLTNPAPNPSGETTRIQFELPQGENAGEIFVYNMDGILVKKYLVDDTFNDLLLNNQDLPTGTYMYQLQTNKTVSDTKKMMIIK